MTFKVITIPGAVTQPGSIAYHGIRYQSEIARPYIHELPRNPFQMVIEYDQLRDKSCVIFSDMAMISYNCGLSFTDEEGREMWLEHQGEQGGDIFKTSRELGQRFILNSFPIYLNTPEWELFLDKGWSAQVEIWSDTYFLVEGVKTGKITKLLPGAYKNTFIHAMKMHKKDGRYYLHNSWRGLKEEHGFYNIYDITEVYRECIEKGILRPYGMAILPYFSWLGKTTTLKDHTRALKAIGVATVSDVWESFKKKVAKVDGEIDKL